MLRAFRRSDAPEFFELMRRSFPAEDALVGFRPDAFVRIVRRVFRPDFRLALGIAEALGHPVFRVYVIEEDHRIAAAGLLTFTERVGYLSTLMVDRSFQRRGFARQLLRAFAELAGKKRRPWIVLDVLTSNDAARALYTSEGYRLLGHRGVWTRELDPAPMPARTPDPIRPMRRRDIAPLVAIASEAIPPPVAEVLPVGPREFRTPTLTGYGFESSTEAWVIDRGAGPLGFVRATASRAMESGHLSQPILDPTADPADARALVEVAGEWIRDRGIRRVILEVPSYNAEALRILPEAGLRELHAIDTLVRPTAA